MSAKKKDDEHRKEAALRSGIMRTVAAMAGNVAFARHRKADPHCTCNDCIAYHDDQLQATEKEESK